MTTRESDNKQRIAVFQQHGSAESKIEGIRRHGDDRFALEIISIDDPLPDIIDDADPYLPESLSADLVLNFLKHPDLSEELGEKCREWDIPMVASGKKHRIDGVVCPPT